MAVKSLVMPDTYRDSVFLMKLSVQARNETGATQVSAMMGTPRNKELFTRSGLITPEIESSKADDLVIAVQAEENHVDNVIEHVRRLLDAAPTKKKGSNNQEVTPQTLEQLQTTEQNISLALISSAGDYGRYEAAKAIKAGIDVMLYSDNISLEDEVALKKLAIKKGCLMMGPDCGTAIIDGVPLAFANTVRRGPIGLIGASGTGLQEVTCLLDRLNAGISQAYGTGGRDLKDEIGGLTTFAGLERLMGDPDTKFIGIIGKPPGGKTRKKLVEKLKLSGMPSIVHFLGSKGYPDEEKAGIAYAENLTEFSQKLAKMAGFTDNLSKVPGEMPSLPTNHKPGFLRGLFSGGTLSQESAELAAPIMGKDMYSNLKIDGFTRIEAFKPSQGNTFWDFGEDEFTVGRPHPMMAPELRMEYLMNELLNPEVSVVLMDLVIGYGAAADQAGFMVKVLEEAEKKSGGKSREKLVVVAVCGSDLDRPSRSSQVEVLQKGGIIVLGSNAQAAIWAASAASGKTNIKERA